MYGVRVTVLLSFNDLALLPTLVSFGLFDVDFEKTHFLAFHLSINKLWSRTTQPTKRH